MQVYVCGGAVRNVLMGVPIKDMDYVVVGATPDEMISLGYTQVGADFPVFLHPTSGDEYALARTERKSGKGYHGFDVDANAEITLEEDLGRRDLTVNAMAVHVDEWLDFVKAASKWEGVKSHGLRYTLDEYVVDPFNGFEDLQNRVARPCALETFVEDPLRLVRAARFSAVYGLSWSNEMVEAARVIVESGELETLSKERFFAEIEKVLKDTKSADHVRDFSLRLMQFKLLPTKFYYSYSVKEVIATMTMDCFTKTGYKSLGAKLNALCPQGIEDAYAERFNFSGSLIDQIDFTHFVLNTAALMAAADARIPMGSADSLLLGVYESIRSGKTGINMEFVADMAEDFEEVKLVLEWLPTVEKVYKEVCFATVKMAPDTPKHMYGVEILVARRQALSKLLNAE